VIEAGNLVKIHHRYWTDRYRNGRFKETYGAQPVPSLDKNNDPIPWMFLNKDDIGLVLDLVFDEPTKLLGGPGRWYAKCIFQERLVKIRIEDILKVQGA
jgi:hypothetical protein